MDALIRIGTIKELEEFCAREFPPVEDWEQRIKELEEFCAREFPPVEDWEQRLDDELLLLGFHYCEQDEPDSESPCYVVACLFRWKSF